MKLNRSTWFFVYARRFVGRCFGAQNPSAELILPGVNTRSALVNRSSSDSKACWLDVSIPFVIEDPSKNYHTDILLTSDCFPGLDGYETGGQENKYEVLLYDVNGKPMTGSKDKTNVVTVPAMRPTMLKCRDFVGNQAFYGGMRLRLQPSGLDSLC